MTHGAASLKKTFSAFYRSEARAAFFDASCRLLPPKGTVAFRWAVAALILAPLLYGLLALWFGQDANWDFRNYHWYNAYAFLTGRSAQDLLPSQIPYFYNPTLDVPFYLLGAHVPARVAGFILGVVQGANFILLFMLAHASLIVTNPLRKVAFCSVLGALGLLGGGALAQVGTTFYDNVTSLGVFGSALLVIRHLEALRLAPWKSAARLALYAGLPVGLMMGLKLPSVIFCVGFCGALLFLGASWQRRFTVAFFFGLGVLIGLGVTLGHWAWSLQTHYGNPLFPYFNDIFKSPYAPFISSRDVQFIPQTWTDRLLFPYIFAANPFRVGEIAWRDLRIPLLYFFLPIAVFFRFYGVREKKLRPVVLPEVVKYLLVAASLSYFVWMFLFSIYRYAVPLEMLSPLLVVCTISLLPLRLRVRSAMTVSVLLLLAVTVEAGNWGRKDGWLDRVVEVDRPEISDPSHLMILMAGQEPYSHVITAFPPEISFVRIQSNFASPEQGRGINQVVRDRLRAHLEKDGRFMLLIPPWQHKVAEKALRYFSFTLKPQTCQTIDDHLYDKLDLCMVVPSTKRTIR